MGSQPWVQHVAVVGTGVVGASWAVYFLSQGLNVAATDPSARGEESLYAMLDRVWPELEAAGVQPGASKARLTFSRDLASALSMAEWVQESGPERAESKRELFAEMDRLTAPNVILATSSSGLPMSEIQLACEHPDRCVTGHPFNPPHLIPAVEVVGGGLTSASTLSSAMHFYRQIGMRPVHLKKEVKGHVANRLQAALWKECVSLLAHDVIAVEDLDELVNWGVGLRWAVMGPAMLFHLGGGQGGMTHFLEHLGPSMTAWWEDLGSPEMTEDVKKKIVDGVRHEARARSIKDLETLRDRMLSAILKTKADLRRDGAI